MHPSIAEGSPLGNNATVGTAGRRGIAGSFSITRSFNIAGSCSITRSHGIAGSFSIAESVQIQELWAEFGNFLCIP